MNGHDDDSTVSDLVLDRYLAGELREPDRTALEMRLASDAPLRARLDELRAGRAAFSMSAPSFEAVAARASSRRRWRPAWPALVPALAAAVAIIVVLASPPVEEDGVRTKGGERLLSYWIERDGRVLEGEPSASLQGGDRLRFQVERPGRGYAAVLGYDARGDVTVYAPRGHAMAAMEGEHLFDNSVRLDDSAGKELLVAVWCPSQRSLADLETTLRDDHGRGSPSLPEGCVYDVVSVRKRTPQR